MSETAVLLAEMVDRLFADHVDMELLNAAKAGRWPQELWRLIEQQGLLSALVPEKQNGMGASFQETYAIVHAAGRHRVPLPLSETMAAHWLLASAGLDVPAGPLAIAGTRPDDTFALHRDALGWRLSGSIHGVAWGRIAKAVVLSLRYEGKIHIALAACAGGTVAPAANLAGEFRDTIVFDNHAVELASWSGEGADMPVLVLGGLMRSGLMAGALADVLARSVAYAGDRRQFGRPISKQQAVQQNLALLAEEAAAAQAAAELAFAAFDRGNPGFDVAVAKTRAGQASSQAVAIAHQVHGAIGYALEHPLHASTLRLMAWRTEFGSDRYWAELLGRRVLALGPEEFWPQITAS
jgi:alkylation response protein AidB-like acyl-CoA dehydrogenase